MVLPARAPLTARAAIDLPGVGAVGLAAGDRGLAHLWFLAGDRPPSGGEGLPERPDHPAIAAGIAALLAWTTGTAVDDPPLDLGGLPPFTHLVLTTLRSVPRGVTVTYGGLAARCGRPGAARAVGQAMARNPLPILIPCHRVVAGDGIGGFTPGLAVKRRLWAVEGLA